MADQDARVRIVLADRIVWGSIARLDGIMNRGRKQTTAARAAYAAAAQRRSATAEGRAHLLRASQAGAAAKRGTSHKHDTQARAKMSESARKRAATAAGRSHLLQASALGAAARRNGK